MKITILILFSVCISNVLFAQDCYLQTNGAYVYSAEDNPGDKREFNEFIRFYDKENGISPSENTSEESVEVITAISLYSLEQSINWFYEENESVSSGSYKKEGCHIEFTTRSETGKYYYVGHIVGDVLNLHVLYPGKKKKKHMVSLVFEFKPMKLR